MLPALLLFIAALALGVMTAIPVGALQVEVVRRTLSHRHREALILVLGSATCDICYGSLALFGLAPMLQRSWVSVVLRGIGAVLMTLMGIHAVRNAVPAAQPDSEARPSSRARSAFVTGLTLSASNPLMMLWWIMGYKLLTDIGLIPPALTWHPVVILTGGIIGMASYPAVMSTVVRNSAHRLSPDAVASVIRWCGVLLIICGVIVGVRAAMGTVN